MVWFEVKNTGEGGGGGVDSKLGFLQLFIYLVFRFSVCFFFFIKYIEGGGVDVRHLSLGSGRKFIFSACRFFFLYLFSKRLLQNIGCPIDIVFYFIVFVNRGMKEFLECQLNNCCPIFFLFPSTKLHKKII